MNNAIFKTLPMILPDQDGAIFNGKIFRFGAGGKGSVYSVDAIYAAEGSDNVPVQPIAGVQLDRADVIVPHCNAVVFGTEYAEPGDEYPLLYANIYNNYQKCDERLEGTACVYRLWQDAEGYHTKLMQIIRVGFVGDLSLWTSKPDRGDVRPYGNFVVEREKNRLWAFTMRDADRTTRYFAFRLPKLGEGVFSKTYGVNVVTLGKDDILKQFDCEYSCYIQGACCENGMIVSVEGFSDEHHPAKMQVIDLEAGKQALAVDLRGRGMTIEPEFCDFADTPNGRRLIYSDGHGAIFEVTFE